MNYEQIGTIITESIRSQLAKKGLVVRRTGYCKKTERTVHATVEGDVVEVRHHRHWDIGRWEIHGNYAIIPQSYFDKFEPRLDTSSTNKKPIYYYPAERTKTYSTIAGDLLLAVTDTPTNLN